MFGGLLAVASVGACEDETATPTATPTTPTATPTTPSAEGSGADRAAAPKAEAEAPPPSGHAVAKVGALLFSSSTGDVGFELPPLGEGSAALGMTVNVVGEQEGRLVIETLVAAPPEHHCAATLDGLADFRLRLYLAATDLLPVLTKDYVHESADGTKIEISRGVPVPSGATTLRVRGTKIEQAVPSDHLGRFYEPAERYSRDRSSGTLHPLEGHPLTVDGRVFDESGLYRDGSGPLRFASTPKGDDALVTVRNPCLEVTALVSGERLRAAPVLPPGRYAIKGPGAEEGLVASELFAAAEVTGSGGLGLAGAGVGGSPVYEVKAGTAILWADGRPAGQVTADHRFAAKPRDEGGRTCFDAPLTAGHPTTLALCFAPEDVGEAAAPVVGILGSRFGPGEVGEMASLESGEGGGSGLRGLGGRPPPKGPRVSPAKPAIKGSLDKDVIRRIVRAHMNEVRYCYEQGLMRDPSLAGKVSITFTVDPAGSVAVATVASSTLSDPKVDGCIAKAVKRWKFPKPTGGGVVVVTYPFVFEST